MYVLGVQKVCISLILHVQMYSTLVPALKRTSVYFIGTSQIRLVSFCKQHISKSKQKPAQKKDIVLTHLNKTACKILSVFNKVHSWPKILNTLYTLSLSNTCLWQICLLHSWMLATPFYKLSINSKKCQTSLGRNSVWSCKQVIFEDPFLKKKKNLRLK